VKSTEVLPHSLPLAILACAMLVGALATPATAMRVVDSADAATITAGTTPNGLWSQQGCSVPCCECGEDQGCEYAKCLTDGNHRDCDPTKQGTGCLESPMWRICCRWHKYTPTLLRNCGTHVGAMNKYAVQTSDGGTLWTNQDITTPCKAS
jgi:hypothetical protein